jgi:protein O-mannosyl-transferase
LRGGLAGDSTPRRGEDYISVNAPRTDNIQRKSLVWLQAAILIIFTCAAYFPVVHNGFVWDDPEYVVNNGTLRSTNGLAAMWTDVTALPQWYPMVHTTFWVEYHLWRVNPLGYHVDNVLLHLAGAILLWRLLMQLNVPGAWLGAMIFALHPVHVESVAWITERKNTLSTLFYFAAALAFLRWRAGWGPRDLELRRWKDGIAWYFAALVLFVAAVTSKSVTCTLPAALLLICWWKTGRIGWRDLLAVLPMIAIGCRMAFITAWLEMHNVGALGARWHYAATPVGEAVARTLIAGRVVWFYAWKLVAPVDLAFIYPRWHINSAAAWQYAFPIALVAAIAALWVLRRRFGRGLLVGPLFFVGTLTPALGYFNVYPMQFSFVADHFQHLASVGLTSAAAAAIAMTARKMRSHLGQQWLRCSVAAALIALAALTAHQAMIYRDAITLWTDTIAKNPNSWVAQYNVGRAIIDDGEDDAHVERAAIYFRKALELAPDVPDPHISVGIVEMRHNHPESARQQFEEALRLKPDFAAAMLQLGKLAVQEHKPAEGERYYRRALGVIPGYPEAHAAYAQLLEQENRLADAVAHWRLAVENEPENPDFHFNLARLAKQMKLDDEAWANLGWGWLLSGDNVTAARAFREALRVHPGYEPAAVGLKRATDE